MKRNHKLILTAAAAVIFFASCSQPAENTPAIPRDEEIEKRVDQILRGMTLEEKVAQMMQIPYNMTGREEALRWAKLGAGSFLHVLGDDAREIQQTAINESRLGIPVIFGIDAIHGHGLNDHATIFPTQLAAACSWNPELARIMGW